MTRRPMPRPNPANLPRAAIQPPLSPPILPMPSSPPSHLLFFLRADLVRGPPSLSMAAAARAVWLVVEHEVDEQLARRLVAQPRLLVHRLRDHRLEARRHPRLHPPHRLRL